MKVFTQHNTYSEVLLYLDSASTVYKVLRQDYTEDISLVFDPEKGIRYLVILQLYESI